ncbi:MAG: RNA polymerase sigma factor [Oscillospiraceae bacterium]
MENFNLEDVVRSYGAKLFRYVYTILCNYQDAEDVVQDVFIAAFNGRERFEGDDISPWLYKIAYNKCVDHMRRHRILSFQELREDRLCTEQNFDTGYSPDVIRALKRLTDKDRAIVLGRISGSLSYEELSERLNISEPALRKRYERAKKKLTEYLKELEGEVY